MHVQPLNANENHSHLEYMRMLNANLNKNHSHLIVSRGTIGARKNKYVSRGTFNMGAQGGGGRLLHIQMHLKNISQKCGRTHWG